MKKELLFPQDCDGEQYLRRLIDAYPYDIEEARVLALLTAQPHPSPYLLEFLTYAATLSKFRLCSSEAARNPSLDTLFQNMAVLKQKDSSLLHMQPFGFDATLQLRVCEVSHPYAHLPLEQIPFISQVQLHHVPRTAGRLSRRPVSAHCLVPATGLHSHFCLSLRKGSGLLLLR